MAHVCMVARMSHTYTGAPTVPQWTIADRLRKARAVARMSQTDLANALGVARATVANWESERTSPARGRLMDAAAATNTPPTWLMDAPEVDQ